MSKMWKANGEQQQYLDRLFRDKQITSNMKPNVIQKKYPIFHGFSAAVFRKHWSQTKQMFDDNLDPDNNNATDVDDKSIMGAGRIQEIDGTESISDSSENIRLSLRQTCKDKFLPTKFFQPPVLKCSYVDPDSKQEKCLVVMLLFNGVKAINFELIQSNSEPEPTLKVTYRWPLLMFNVKSMFKRDDENNMFVSNIHPKVLAVDKALEHFRHNIEDAPEGIIEVKLPFEVQMDPTTWTRTFNKKNDGSINVFSEFLSVRKEYIIAKGEKTLASE